MMCRECGREIERLEWASCAYDEGSPLAVLIFGAVQRCGPYEIAPTPWPAGDDGSASWTVSCGLSEIGRHPSISSCRGAADSTYTSVSTTPPLQLFLRSTGGRAVSNNMTLKVLQCNDFSYLNGSGRRRVNSEKKKKPPKPRVLQMSSADTSTGKGQRGEE